MSRLAITAVVLSALILPSTAFAATGLPKTLPGDASSEAQFFLQGSNGYSAYVEGNGNAIALDVEGRRGTVIYHVRGRSSTRGIKARIGNLGRIAVRFRSTGRVFRTGPPKRCKGKDEITREGVFTGTIEFVGENGYTRLSAHRVPGSTTVPRAWRCKPGHRDGPLDEGLAGSTVLAAFTPHQQAVFAAIGGEPEGESQIYFLAGTIERRGSVRIERGAFVDAQPSTFSFPADLGSATVQPPQPFSGTASFTRNLDGSTNWSGPLSVSLPGTGPLELTGPTFKADLAQPKTLAEYLDLFGLPSGTRPGTGGVRRSSA